MAYAWGDPMGQHSKPDDNNDFGGPAMLTASFWTGAADRAVKSFAQALLLLWGGSEIFNILEISPGPAFGVAGGAAVLSVLTSIVSAPAGDKGSTSFLSGGS